MAAAEGEVENKQPGCHGGDKSFYILAS